MSLLASSKTKKTCFFTHILALEILSKNYHFDLLQKLVFELLPPFNIYIKPGSFIFAYMTLENSHDLK